MRRQTNSQTFGLRVRETFTARGPHQLDGAGAGPGSALLTRNHLAAGQSVRGRDGCWRERLPGESSPLFLLLPSLKVPSLVLTG